MASPSRAGSPLASPGARRKVFVSLASAINVRDVAAAFGLTQRIVLDAVLEDLDRLRNAAQRKAIRMGRSGPGRMRAGDKADERA